MDRFHIVVFNFEQIILFINNFDKIKNFDSVQDKIYVFDPSRNQAAQKAQLEEFAHKQGWKLGEQVHFIRRKNWGRDQGGRIDYMCYLRQMPNKPKYIWQFQMHYLDLSSEFSRWSRGTYNVDGRYLGGQLKGDTIPDGLVIDLNKCEEIYEKYPKVCIIYADRLKIGVFTHKNRSESFYLDGVNFSVRASYALHVYNQNLSDIYRLLYDGSYSWTLFIEFDLGRELTREGIEWYDLVSNCHFEDPRSLKLVEEDLNVCLHQNAEEFYGPLYLQYEKYKLKLISTNNLLQKLLIRKLFLYCNFMEKLKRFLAYKDSYYSGN